MSDYKHPMTLRECMEAEEPLTSNQGLDEMTEGELRALVERMHGQLDAAEQHVKILQEQRASSEPAVCNCGCRAPYGHHLSCPRYKKRPPKPNPNHNHPHTCETEPDCAACELDYWIGEAKKVSNATKGINGENADEGIRATAPPSAGKDLSISVQVGRNLPREVYELRQALGDTLRYMDGSLKHLDKDRVYALAGLSPTKPPRPTVDELRDEIRAKKGIPPKYTEPVMPMLPNDKHPGHGCSCRECLRRYPETKNDAEALKGYDEKMNRAAESKPAHEKEGSHD